MGASPPIDRSCLHLEGATVRILFDIASFIVDHSSLEGSEVLVEG